MCFLQTFPGQKSMPSSWYSSSSLSSASSSISSALILLACRSDGKMPWNRNIWTDSIHVPQKMTTQSGKNLDLLKIATPKKKNTSVFIIDSPFQTRMSNWEKLKCHLQQTSPKVEAPTPTSALVILFPLPFDIRPPMAGEPRELRGEGAIWCTWRVVAVVAVRYFGISFKTFP